MINSIETWGIADECPGIELEKVFPVSTRASCLVARCKDKPVLKTNFINVQGALDMMKGLDYHHTNFMNAINALGEERMAENVRALKDILLHEVVAYLNRLGQFYYFCQSPFMTKNYPTTKSLIPDITTHVVFRHKHGAHRSLDAPKGETEHVQVAQAWSMSSIGGNLFEPKPGQYRDLSKIKDAEGLEQHIRENWKNCYLMFQIIGDKPYAFNNFSIEKEHGTIMKQAYSVFELILT